MPPMPLSRIERLVLGRPPSINRSEKEGEERVWDSMGITAQQPWAARWLSACHEPDCGAYAWMQVQPVRYSINMRAPSAQHIHFTDEQHTAWFEFLHAYLPSPEWCVRQMGRAVMVGLCRQKHPDAAAPGQLEHYPLWLRLKTELEMTLFEAVRQGASWSGTNGLQVSGSGAWPEEGAHVVQALQAERWPATWAAWVSAEAKYQALGKSYGIEVLPHFDAERIKALINLSPAGMQQGIWIDLPSLVGHSGKGQALAALEWGVKAWQQGMVEEVSVSSWIQNQHYTFTLPAWPGCLGWSRGRRWFYGINTELQSRRHPWTGARFMTDILGYHPPQPAQ